VHGTAVNLAQEVAGGGDLTRHFSGTSLPESHDFNIASLRRGLEHESNADFFFRGAAGGGKGSLRHR
jgi:hypothetical protein